MCRVMVAVLIYACTTATWVFAQPPSNSTTGHANLVTLERMWAQAQIRRDMGTVAAMIGEHFVDTEFDGITKDRKAYLAEVAQPELKPIVMDIDTVHVEVYGATAVVTGDYHAKGSYAGKPYDHWGRFTDTWVYQGDRWVCVASHSSRKK